MNIPLAIKQLDDVQLLITFLKEKDYKIDNYLINHTNDRRYLKAIWVDIDKRYVYPCDSSTIMACWCSSKRKLLFINEFIELYPRIVINKDYAFYEYLIHQNYFDNNRPGGVVLSIESARAIKNNKRLIELISMIDESRG